MISGTPKVAAGDQSQEQGMVEITLLACSIMLDQFRPSGKPHLMRGMQPPEALPVLGIETVFFGGGNVSTPCWMAGTLEKFLHFPDKCSL